eukprot:EG_transcript_38592
MEQLECPICLKTPTDPIALACPHTLCRVCAAEQVGFQRGRDGGGDSLPVLHCPICRQPTDVTVGVAALPSYHQSGEDDKLQTTPNCDRCGVFPALKDCMPCRSKFCPNCYKEVHVGLWESHQIADVSALKNECNEHNREVEKFCCTCSIFVCAQCRQSSHRSHT